MADLERLFSPLVSAEGDRTPTRAELQTRVARIRRRRWTRRAASLLAVAVVIAGVATLGPGRKQPARVTTPSSTVAPRRAPSRFVTGIGWQIDLPAGWHFEQSNVVCGSRLAGLYLTPDPKALQAYEGQTDCLAKPPAAGLVAITLVDEISGQPVNVDVPSTPLPISLADTPAELNQPSVLGTSIENHGQSFDLRVILDPNAPAATRDLVNATLRSLRRVPGLPAEPPLLGRDARDLSVTVEGIAVDAGNDVYIASGLNRVIEIGQNGRVIRVIGNGTRGGLGDGGPAANAQLDSPMGVAVDGAGNVYIADAGNNRIRRVAPSGIITTYAGTGAAVSGADGRPADRTALNQPDDLLYDQTTQSLYVAEGSKVRRIGADGIVHTVAGTGKQEIGVEVQAGNLATRTPLCIPDGIAITTDGSLWIADFCDKSIDRVGPDGHIRKAPGNAFRLAAAPDGSVSAYYGRDGGIDRVTPTSDTGLVQLNIRAPVASCIHYTGNGDDDAALTWHGNTLYFANPAMGRVCTRDADGTIRTIVGG